MARSEDTLQAVFQDTANAIRNKTGGSSTIIPRDFADEIMTIPASSESAAYRAAVVELLKGTETSIDLTLYPEVTTLRSYIGYQDTVLTTFKSGNVTQIPNEAFDGCTNLATVEFDLAITRIGDYAFRGCTKIDNLTIPHTVTYIGSYAFQNVGSYYSQNTHTFEFVDNVGVETYVNSYAFQQSHLSNLEAIMTYIGSYAFQNCSSLLTVDITIDDGPIYDYAFSECRNVTSFTINSSSNITYLGSYVFQYLCSNTYTTATVGEFNFANSSFDTLRSGVWAYCYFNGTVIFPSSLKNISGNAWNSARGNWTVAFNSIPTLSSSSYIPSDTANFTMKLLFPYEMLDEASSTTNWSTHSSRMIGYGTGYAAGSTLPTHTKTTGVKITWYSDQSLTTVVTISASASDIYYCTLGSVRETWYLTETAVDASITVVDTNNVQYGPSNPFIPINSTITITTTGTDVTKQLLYLLQINGTDYTSAGTATITVASDVDIKCMYWNGVDYPFLPNLADNEWSMIKMASQLGVVPSTWNVGDTKTYTLNGHTYTARLSDKTGKFTRVSDGSTAWLKFETVECSEEGVAFNSSNNNAVANSPLLISLNSGDLWNTLDSGLKAALEDVNVQVNPGNGSTSVSTLPFKIFFHRSHDLYDSNNGWTSTAEWNAVARQDEYYISHNTNADRIKKRVTSQDNYYYWMMTPFSGNTGSVLIVNSDGSISGSSAHSSGIRYSPCFAL